MKIVRPICCGMDVHKNTVVATINITNKKTCMTDYIQETFSILNPDLLCLKQWIINHKCFDACTESIGNSHFNLSGLSSINSYALRYIPFKIQFLNTVY